MLLLFLFSVVLLGSAAGSDDTTSATVNGLAACPEGAEKTLTAATQTELQQVKQQLEQKVTAIQQQLTAVQQQLGQTAVGNCPANWIRRDNNCYLLSTQKANRLQAGASCPDLDDRARLASVHPANKDHVASLVTASGVSVWIGLYRPSEDWTWSDFTPLDFTNWVMNQPDNKNEDKKCVAAVGRNGGKWEKINCDETFRFICQMTL